MPNIQDSIEVSTSTLPMKIPCAGIPIIDADAPKSLNNFHVDATKAVGLSAPATANTSTKQLKEKFTNEEAKETTPAWDGVQGYSAPGLIKALRFSKRYFHFSEKPIQCKQLFVFLQDTNPTANPIIECASQAGTSFFFFKKAIPTNVFILADISNITKEGPTGFQFKVNGQMFTFQASTDIERDSWVNALETELANAKAEKGIINSSGTYKARLQRLITFMRSLDTNEAAIDESMPTKDNNNSKISSQYCKRAGIFRLFSGNKGEGQKEEAKKSTPEEYKPTISELVVESATAAIVPSRTPNKLAGKVAKKTNSSIIPNLDRGPLFGDFLQNATSSINSDTTTISSQATRLENPFEQSTLELLVPQRAITPIKAESSKNLAIPAEASDVITDGPTNTMNVATNSQSNDIPKIWMEATKKKVVKRIRTGLE
ncbi:Pleckstrin homology domain-containing protein [Xylogone sp. PMI_703]|nr:Pleckstrin homology domain-containing protein [Xylogone sp. PMI_703]